MASASAPANPSLLTLALVGGLGLVLGGGSMYFLKDNVTSALPQLTATAQPERDTVETLARLQPAGGVISVLGPPGDQVEELLVTQGQPVKKDQVIVRLSSLPDRQLDEELARRQLEEARGQEKAIRQVGEAKLAVLDAKREQSRGEHEQDVLAQKAKIEVIVAQRDQAKAHLDRLEGLIKARIAVSPQELEQARLVLRQNEGELKSASALLKKTEITAAGDDALAARRRAASTETEQALHRLPIRSLEQALAIARRKTELATIKAPVSGTVLKVNGHRGDPTGRFPLLDLAAGEGLIAVAEAYETDAALLRQWLANGSIDVEVSGSALAKPIRGRLTRAEQIAGSVSREQPLNSGPRADYRRLVEVKVDLESARQVGYLIGLQVTVKFRRQSKP